LAEAVFTGFCNHDNVRSKGQQTMPKSMTTSSKDLWSAKVTRESHALDLEEGVFTWTDPKEIARSLKESADASKNRKATAFRSAMSMLVFYINRAGSNLSDDRKHVLERAKDELRRLYGRD
jgi:hypothetical protein